MEPPGMLLETARITLPAARTTAGATPRETFSTSAEDGQGPGLRAASALLSALIHRSAWNRNSANFAITEFSEVRMLRGLSLTSFAYSVRLQRTASVVA